MGAVRRYVVDKRELESPSRSRKRSRAELTESRKEDKENVVRKRRC